MKILLVANTGWYVYNFRRNLARALQDGGNDVVVVCPRDAYVSKLQRQGFRWIDWRVHRSRMNPFGEWAALWELSRIYRRERPDLVHHFTIKCIVYGTLAARIAGVARIVNAVTGLGHVFVSDNPVMRLLRPFLHRWYAWALTSPGVRPMFQNRDDLAVLAAQAPQLNARAVLSNGSGVDLTRFTPAAQRPAASARQRLTVVFAGRLIEQKGVCELVEAARLLRSRGSSARFLLCGAADPGNPSSISDDRLRAWHDEGVVELLGHVDDIETVLREADLVVLPSYREGTPRVLLEAAAMGKPIVTTDVPGCREVVVDGETGILVPPCESEALADAIETLLNDAQLRREMGRAGRTRMEREFDERTVIRDTLRVYEDLLEAATPLAV